MLPGGLPFPGVEEFVEEGIGFCGADEEGVDEGKGGGGGFSGPGPGGGGVMPGVEVETGTSVIGDPHSTFPPLVVLEPVTGPFPPPAIASI